MCTIRERLSNIFFYSDLHATRATLSIAELLWAVSLLWPGDTFVRPTYTEMAHVMSEEAWGFIFLLSCITQAGIVLKGDYHSRFATYFAGWNSGLWLFVCYSMYISVYPPPAAISGEAALAFAATWIWARSGFKVKGRRSVDY